MIKNRDLSNEEKLLIDNKVEKFLNDEVFSWDIIGEDEGIEVDEFIEEKIIKEIIKVLKDRISYY
jgi:hypothetical protein